MSSTLGPPTLDDALAYLDAHVNFETAPQRRAQPTLARMKTVCQLLGDPQLSYPVVHLTGTNGKGSTARMTTALLQAHGLAVGTYTSPHLERVNERVAWDGEPIADAELAAHLMSLAPLEKHLGVLLTHFEVLTAAAFAWFADVAVDAAVVEVGMGGRWDSTNVTEAAVAVVTNVGLDHAEVLGPTRLDIATEKAGIVKPGATLVLGETSEALQKPFLERGAAEVWRRDRDFGCVDNRVAVGGRLLELRTPGGSYEEVFLPLFGAHQGDNAACAVAAAEAFFGRPLDPDVVSATLAGVSVPGRFEVMGRRPLVVLDGAHNPDGARALADTLAEDLAGRFPDVLVVGFTAGRDPAEMLSILEAHRARRVLAVRPPSPRGLAAEEVAAAAPPGVRVEPVASVPEALDEAVVAAGADGFVLVTGSLYVVGDARIALH